LPKDYENETTILRKHRSWITEKEQTIKQALEEAERKSLNPERTDTELREFVHSVAATYRRKFGFKLNRIFFRKMKTKWGSYSSSRNLTINTLSKYLPKRLVEYVIFHEMVHSEERKHNERFWKTVSRTFEDYQTKERDLLVYWFIVMKHLDATPLHQNSGSSALGK